MQIDKLFFFQPKCANIICWNTKKLRTRQASNNALHLLVKLVSITQKKEDIPNEKNWEHRAGASFKECSDTTYEAAAFYGQAAAVFSSDHFWGYDPSCEIQCDWAGGSCFSHYVKLAIFTTVPATPSAIYFNECSAESRESEHSRILNMEDAAQALSPVQIYSGMYLQKESAKANNTSNIYTTVFTVVAFHSSQ